MTTKIVREYQANLTLTNDTTCTFKGSCLEDIESNISMLLKGGPVRYETREGNSILIYHDSHSASKEPLGWIVEYEVPHTMRASEQPHLRPVTHGARRHAANFTLRKVHPSTRAPRLELAGRPQQGMGRKLGTVGTLTRPVELDPC